MLEHLRPRKATHGLVHQVTLGNKTGITWVPGTRAVKLRYDRMWLKCILGRQSLRVSWGLSERHVDRTGDG